MTQHLPWLRGLNHLTDVEPDLRWAWVTVALSALVVTGYCAIAFNWFFQAKLEVRHESKAALNRLRAIVLGCALCGYWFAVSDMSWPVWRLYDLVLLGLTIYTWRFAMRMRGLGLLDERLAQAAELERSANKYREIAELLPHMVWTATADGSVDFSNNRWAEYRGDGRTWLESIHPDERQGVLEWWDQGRAGRDLITREVRLEGVEGYRTFVVTATPIVRGNAVKWLGACADIEDQKRLAAEKELQSQQKTFFLNALSHDLRAPLNNVVLNAHLLKMSAREAAEVESAKVIVENAVAAGDMLTKLLEVARAGGQDRNARDVFPAAALLHHVARRFQPIAERKGLYLRIEADDGVEVLTDRQKLERVIVNLVDNGIKFTDTGGVTVELARLDDGICIAVSDTGIGVPDAHSPHLFDEFYQVNNHERDRSKGFGMGLAICRSLARQLGGDVRLARTGPRGSRFELAVKGVCAGGGGRPGREAGRHTHPQNAGVLSN
jgi:signal transduction histidine kinase